MATLLDRDQNLLAALREREPTAAEALITAYGDRAYRLAMRITGNAQDAEEVVQDALCTVSWRIDHFRSEAAFRSWLFRIVSSGCVFESVSNHPRTPSSSHPQWLERARTRECEARERRGGQAMTRLRRASVIAVLSSVACAATASAERTWILWSQGIRNKAAITWFTVGAYPSLNECRTALKEAAGNLHNSGYELISTAESITAVKDDDNFTGLTCLPDTVDLRRAEGKMNDAP
jgi:hypothetical protein